MDPMGLLWLLWLLFLLLLLSQWPCVREGGHPCQRMVEMHVGDAALRGPGHTVL